MMEIQLLYSLAAPLDDKQENDANIVALPETSTAPPHPIVDFAPGYDSSDYDTWRSSFINI